MNTPLDLFLPPVRAWFSRHLGEPTPPQKAGWPAIAAGQHTLILAPTGSGKTLAAFLSCLDHLWRQTELPRAVQVLYVSPLKALNNDIHRNLQVPLAGVAQMAAEMGVSLPDIEAGVRTGDTPTSERQRMARRPPHVLITTPESLHLILTSRSRDMLRSVKYVIIDEIHALCTNKRGVFLSLLLERLAALQRDNGAFVRIGLSATQRPLDEVARYLGGLEPDAAGILKERPVTIVDAGLRKDLDLSVINPVEQFGPLPEQSVWPSIYRLIVSEIRQHRSTIVFANDRRSVERITAFLNEDDELCRAHHGSVDLERRQEIESALKEGRLPAVCATASLELGIDMGAVDLVCQVASPGNVARGLQRVGRAGHLVGGRSKGRFIPRTPADLLEQAVLVREMVAGRVEAIRVPINCLDVLAQQLVAMAAMDTWDVPELYALVRRAYPYRDLTASAFEATVEMIAGRYRFTPVGQAFQPDAPSQAGKPDAPSQAFQPDAPSQAGKPDLPKSQAGKPDLPKSQAGKPDLPKSQAGKPDLPKSQAGKPDLPKSQAGKPDLGSMESLQPRVSWDRIHNRLVALPGSQQTALVNGGTIPDTGQYAAYLSNGTRIGELDEEFIYERRVGDSFLLGTNAWRLDRIDSDRVIVSPAEGAPAMVPFWRGEGTGRTYGLGQAIGAFLRELTERISERDCLDWLQKECHLDRNAARSLHHHVTRQLLSAGLVPTDRTLLIEASRDQLGDWQVLLLSPFGQRLHLALRLVLEARLNQRLGYRPQCLHHDDGIVVRLSDTDEPIVDLLSGLSPDNIEGMILDELADSALFALRFRQNAARSLLLPRGRAGKRAPLWLQRLRGRDLLQVARRHPDFPVVVETFRECLHDHLDVPRLKELLANIASGEVKVVTRRAESPSPFAAGLMFAFTAASMYQYDDVESATGKADNLDRELLGQLVAPQDQEHLLDPRSVLQVERRLRGVGMPPRTPAEMAEWLRKVGDLTASELEGPMAGFLETLEADGLAVRMTLSRVKEPLRWVHAEEAGMYAEAFGVGQAFQPDIGANPLAGASGCERPVPARRASEGSVAARRASAGTQPEPLAGASGWDRERELSKSQAGKPDLQAALTIFARFLDTHALVGLDDVLTRYPFEREWARRQLEQWVRSGRAVKVSRREGEPEQFAAPSNLDRVQRGSLGLMRKEVITCRPEQFVDFVVRWQRLHPDERRGSSAGCAEVMDRLSGLFLPTEVWEEWVLPARIPGYQRRWLDEWTAGGGGVWLGQGRGDSGVDQVAFLGRGMLAQLAPPEVGEAPTMSDDATKVAEMLQRRGASFVTDLAVDTGLSPSAVRRGLWELARRSLVSNDQFDVVRRGEPADTSDKSNKVRSLRSMRQATMQQPEGRWSLLTWGRPEPEVIALAQCMLLLQGYGVVARELAISQAWLMPWRILYEVLSRLEMTGEVRRGYFVEGLSGAQFALPEAATRLQETHTPSTASAPLILIHSQDPANLYGSGAPFDVPLLDGGTRPLLRRPGNWLVLKAGKPVLLVEQQGKNLTALASAAREDVSAAVKTIPGIFEHQKSLTIRHKITVDAWNGEPVTASPGRELLEAAGFVRDYQGMTLYAAWR